MTTMEITRKIGAPLSKASADFVKSHIDEANADALEGYVLCVANHMEVCDADMDIVKSTAWDASLQSLKDGDAGIAVLYGHDAAGGVVGKVVDGFVLGLEDKTSVLVLELKLNMDKEIGRDCFSDVSGGFLRELSVGFNIPNVEGATKRVKVGSDYAQEIFLADLVEVSFVIRGSSPNTRIIETKEARQLSLDEVKGAMPVHETPVSSADLSWSGSELVASLPLEDPDLYRTIYALLKDDAAPELKGSWRYPHHTYDADDNTAGEAVQKALISSIAILNGAMTSISSLGLTEAEREGIYKHVSAHLRDAGREDIPELKDAPIEEEKEEIGRDRFTTAKEAAQRGEALGCGSTAHEHRDPDTGEVYYMPCPDMAVYRSTDAMRGESPITYSNDTETAKDHTETAAAGAIKALAARMLAGAMLKRLKNQKDDN